MAAGKWPGPWEPLEAGAGHSIGSQSFLPPQSSPRPAGWPEARATLFPGHRKGGLQPHVRGALGRAQVA